MSKVEQCHEIVVRLYKSVEYADFKKQLDRGKHPAFIGRVTFGTNARNGGAYEFRIGEDVVAVALVNPRNSVLLVLNVNPKWRGKGVGEVVVNMLMPNFVRALESVVTWFEKLGYKPIGELKQGRTFRTKIMVREKLIGLVGRLATVFGGSSEQ